MTLAVDELIDGEFDAVRDCALSQCQSSRDDAYEVRLSSLNSCEPRFSHVLLVIR